MRMMLIIMIRSDKKINKFIHSYKKIILIIDNLRNQRSIKKER